MYQFLFKHLTLYLLYHIASSSSSSSRSSDFYICMLLSWVIGFFLQLVILEFSPDCELATHFLNHTYLHLQAVTCAYS